MRQHPKPLKKKICKYCKAYFQPNRPLQYLCLPPNNCSWEYAKKKKQEQIKKDERIEDKKVREKLKTIGQYEAEAKKWFQLWVRIRDSDQPCISCGNPNSNRYDGGHWWKAEIYSGLIFHPDNCHKQCSRPCNKDLNGDQANYRIGLVKRIGEERVRWLEENKDRLRNYKFTKQELIDIKNHYKNLTKQLKQQENEKNRIPESYAGEPDDRIS